MPPGSGVLRMSIGRLGTQQRYFVSWIALECLTVLLKEQVEVADGESPAQSAAPGNQTRISRTRQTAGWTDFLSEGFLWITHCKYYHIVAFLHQPNGSSHETGKRPQRLHRDHMLGGQTEHQSYRLCSGGSSQNTAGKKCFVCAFVWHSQRTEQGNGLNVVFIFTILGTTFTQECGKQHSEIYSSTESLPVLGAAQVLCHTLLNLFF